MSPTASELPTIDHKVVQLFALVSEALSRATDALLGGDVVLGQSVIDGDQAVDSLTSEVELLIWEELQERPVQGNELRYLVGLLLIIPELERSADLAEHVAQRAVDHLGTAMCPASRGIVQLMTEVANEMWQVAADAFGERERIAERLAKADEEMDILHDQFDPGGRRRGDAGPSPPRSPSWPASTSAWVTTPSTSPAGSSCWPTPGPDPVVPVVPT